MTKPMLMVDNVGVNFGGFKAVDGFSMIVARGELRVLLGANGAGKTTLMDLISGKTPLTEGKVFLDDRDVTNWQEHALARAGLGRKFQIPSVFKDLTVAENLEVAGIKQHGVLRNIRMRDRRRQLRSMQDVLELTGLGERVDVKAATLSHGETQWLELGILIRQDPKVILLDEPTAGMTQDETLRTSQIINDLKGQHTLIVVEHDMAFVREIAELITVMHMGKLLAEGKIEDIEKNQAVQDAYLGSGGIH
ncbi:MAG: urea ABC transporter ATP-binding protein UrtD [Pseudomonadota bacterium]